MNTKLILLVCALSLCMIFLAGCETDGENARSVVFVTSMNGNAPFFSDVYNFGEDKIPSGDDFIQEDYIDLTFLNRPYSDIVGVGQHDPYGTFIVESYDVTWSRSDGGSAVPPSFSGAMYTVVPTGDVIGATVLAVPSGFKTQAPLLALQGGGEIIAVAHFTFHGHEVGVDRDQTFESNVTITFADFVDPDN